MNGALFERTDDLPKTTGVFNLINTANENLFAGASENLNVEIKKTLAKNDFLNAQTAKIEIYENFGDDLLKFFAEVIRRKKPLYNPSLAAQNLYPHFKITKEKFPRVLVTRRIADDDAEYFGAFLPETGVRFMLGFINRMFRFRGCDIPIDGSLPVPCPEFYSKRCLAPCVESLCDAEKYAETINFARLFFKKNKIGLNEIISDKIQICADRLDYEQAAKWRDFSQAIEDFWTDKNRRCRLEDATDSYDMEKTETGFLIRLVTHRNRKTLNRRTFVFENKIAFAQKEILAQTLWQFYAFHEPKEIIVPVDFPSRKFLERIFKARGASDFKISITKKSTQKVTVKRALKLTELEFGQENLKPEVTFERLQTEFQTEFRLPVKPRRIEAFDVAHISGTDFVGAKSVWAAGKFVAEEYEFWFFDEKSELETLAQTVKSRFSTEKNLPDLILIDGGKSQMQKAFSALAGRKIPIVSAVKPPQKHNEISHFLFEDNRLIKFDDNSNAARILLKLRDEAHALANYIHRTKRETAHYSEFFQALPGLGEKERQSLVQFFGSLGKLKDAAEIDLIKILGAEKGKFIFERLKLEQKDYEPFIVPIRFDDPNGEAADLRLLNLPEKLYK